MADVDSDDESSIKATERRERFAVDAIHQAVRQKAGSRSAHGTFSVRLHWKDGILQRVTVEDATDYR